MSVSISESTVAVGGEGFQEQQQGAEGREEEMEAGRMDVGRWKREEEKRGEGRSLPCRSFFVFAHTRSYLLFLLLSFLPSFFAAESVSFALRRRFSHMIREERPK